MLQPLNDYLRFPVVEDLVESYGPYLEKLLKHDKYCLIGVLALWLQQESEAWYTGGYMPVTSGSFEYIDMHYPLSSTAVDTILKKHLARLNEPLVQSLITALVQQIREGYYRALDSQEQEDYDEQMRPPDDEFHGFEHDEIESLGDARDSEDKD